MKKDNAITLIALILTIIVLIILSGIAINTLTNNGIFERTKEARDKWKNAQNEEEMQIAKYSNEINKYINNSNREDELENKKMKLILTSENSTNANVGTYDISTFTNTPSTLTNNYIEYDETNKLYKVKKSGWYIFNMCIRLNQYSNYVWIYDTLLLNNEETIECSAGSDGKQDVDTNSLTIYLTKDDTFTFEERITNNSSDFWRNCKRKVWTLD